MSPVLLVLLGFLLGSLPSWLILRVNYLQLQEMRKIESAVDDVEILLEQQSPPEAELRNLN